MAGQNKFYRLFKVAKELNVATGMLVDHLQEKGHEVDNSPNTKLSRELYDLLLKEFASEKLMKEKAEQLTERRKEEVRSVSQRSTPVVEEQTEEETDSDFVSAEDLRNSLVSRPRRKRRVVSQNNTPPVSPPAEEKEEVEEEKPVSKLKVIGKIDLDAIGKPKKEIIAEPEKEPEEVEAKLETPVEEPEKESEEQTEIQEEEVSEVPVSEEIPSSKIEQETPVEETEADKKEEVPELAPEDEEDEVEVDELEDEDKSDDEEDDEEEDEEEIIRAGDRTPQLSGLKVMGKIDLSKPKPKKETKKGKQDKNQAEDSNQDEGDDDSGSSKKRRRRRRKRKRKSAVKEDVGGKGGGKDGKKDRKGKKEKPTQKEVDESIRTTLSQMGKGASRTRQRLRRAKRDAGAQRREEEEQKQLEESKVVDVTEFITANEFANLINVPVNNIITKSFELGEMVSINQRLDAELLSVIAEEYGYEANFIDVTDTEYEIEEIEDDPEDLTPRSPIITVMGHVDHGKTTLLDHLRKTNVTAQEAGGITQHIGAYEVKLPSGKNVTFLDTPGHEAFTAMRARGAKATDVVIIVVAADDAVMPQTKEAINHAVAANVPMVFAINKIDKAGADPERIKGQLAEMNFLVEDWGGNYQCQEISALKGEGVTDLLEKVILEADLLELQANPDREATGTVIEARLDKGRGNVATVLVQNGTLTVGDEMVAGIHYGKVRALINQNGKRIKKAGPSVPVQVLGLNGQPQAGDRFYIFNEDGKAKTIAQKRSELYREQQFRQTKRITLEEIGRRRAIGNFKELNVIIRGDVDGSVEALSGSLLKLSNDEVQVNIIWKGVGAISEADINLAIASDAIVIAFNVRPNAQARALAEREEVDIRLYSVIYDAINDVKDALEGLLSPEIKEEIMGTAEVREVFKITKVGNVAGAFCSQGKIKRDDPIRIIRDSVVIYDSKLSSLKRFKDDAKEVVSGQEFGFMVENYNDIKVGDVLESYHVNEIKRKLK